MKRFAFVCALAIAACNGDPLGVPTPTSIAASTWTSAIGASGTTSTLTVGPPLPAGTLSVTWAATTTAVSSPPLVFGVTTVAGDVLIDPTSPEFSRNRALPGRTLATAFVPIASAALPLANGYGVLVGMQAPVVSGAPVELTTWIKTTPTGTDVPALQRLSVFLVLVGNAVTDGRALDGVLATVASIWGRAGVLVTSVGSLKVDASLAAAHARIAIDAALGPDSPDLAALVSLPVGVPAGALPLFIVDDISADGGLSLWALSAGIPVAPLAGTVRSGVAVDGSLFATDAGFAGQVLAHEIGHALGLFHTTESTFVSITDGAAPSAIHDQLDDTPDCPMSADVAPADGTLDASECAAWDAGNLMFWSVPRGSTRLTEDQGAVARRSALTH